MADASGLPQAYPYSLDDMQRLEALLFSDRFPDAIDCVGLHGLCSALAVGPSHDDAFDLAAFILGAESIESDERKQAGEDSVNCSPEEAAFLSDRTSALVKHIRRQLDNEQLPALPDEIETDKDAADEDSQTALENWCLGFTEIVLTLEDRWFAEQADEIATLIAPILAVADVEDLSDDTELATTSLAELLERGADGDFSIPERLIDLYLIFNGE
ncbi:UPF0149 family protein [Allohahella marinimesophila]|uniref:YecA family protein n=1 Tax=Allohahella marinimesophila TaxID=1054972 RepID=A0ABP7NPP5_9GAMM